jgi:hypothetical protein
VWQRIRWGNVGRLSAAIAVLALVVAWPRLAAPPPRLRGDEPIAVGPEKTPARPRAKGRARAKRDAGAKRDAAAKRAAAAKGDARRAARPRRRAGNLARRAPRPVLGGGMVDARPLGPAGGAPAEGGDGAARAGGGRGAAGLSPPPAPPDPAALEFGPER